MNLLYSFFIFLLKRERQAVVNMKLRCQGKSKLQGLRCTMKKYK